MKKALPISLFIVFFLSIGIGVWYWQGFTRKSTNVRVKLKWLHQAQFAGMYVAKEEHLYRRQGLNVTIEEYNFSDDQIERLLAGEIDFAVVSAEEVILALDRGEPIKAVAAIYQVSPYAIVSLSEKNIDSPADFQGKMLGNKGAKEEEDVFYHLLLKSVGLTTDDVDLIDLSLDQSELEDLKNNRADVIGLYRTDQLYIFEQEGIDYNIILPEHYGINLYNDVIITHTDTLAENPEMVKKFLAATVQGWDLALDDQELAIDHTMKYVTSDVYSDRAYQKYILEKSENLIRPNPNVSVGIMSATNWKRLNQSMINKGLVTTDLEADRIFSSEYLP